MNKLYLGLLLALTLGLKAADQEPKIDLLGNAEDGRDSSKRLKRDEPSNGNGSSSSNMNV